MTTLSSGLHHFDDIDGSISAAERAKTRVYRSKRGTHWHLETPNGTPVLRYVLTACAVRLSRSDLVPTRTLGEVHTATVCADCLRKTNEHIITIQTGARP